MDFDIHKLFDDVFVYKRTLEYWEREQIINQIMIIRNLLFAKNNVYEDEYHTTEDETIVFILYQLFEIYGLKFFSTKNLENINDLS